MDETGDSPRKQGERPGHDDDSDDPIAKRRTENVGDLSRIAFPIFGDVSGRRFRSAEVGEQSGDAEHGERATEKSVLGRCEQKAGEDED